MNNVIDNIKDPEPKFFLADEITHWLQKEMKTRQSLKLIELPAYHRGEYENFNDGKTIVYHEIIVSTEIMIGERTIHKSTNSLRLPDVVKPEFQVSNMRLLGDCIANVQTLQPLVSDLNKRITYLESKLPPNT